jgi:hypothetical protein
MPAATRPRPSGEAPDGPCTATVARMRRPGPGAGVTPASSSGVPGGARAASVRRAPLARQAARTPRAAGGRTPWSLTIAGRPPIRTRILPASRTPTIRARTGTPASGEAGGAAWPSVGGGGGAGGAGAGAAGAGGRAGAGGAAGAGGGAGAGGAGAGGAGGAGGTGGGAGAASAGPTASASAASAAAAAALRAIAVLDGSALIVAAVMSGGPGAKTSCCGGGSGGPPATRAGRAWRRRGRGKTSGNLSPQRGGRRCLMWARRWSGAGR